MSGLRILHPGPLDDGGRKGDVVSVWFGSVKRLVSVSDICAMHRSGETSVKRCPSTPLSRAPVGLQWIRAFALRDVALEIMTVVVQKPASHRDKGARGLVTIRSFNRKPQACASRRIMTYVRAHACGLRLND